MTLRYRVIGLAALVLCMSSCTPTATTLTNVLSIVTQAAEVALPIIGGAAGMDPAALSAATSYVNLADTAIVTVAKELQSTDATGTKAAKVTAAFIPVANGVAATQSGIPTQLKGVLTAIAGAAQTFLGEVQKSQALGVTHGAVAGAGTKLELTGGQKRLLNGFARRAEANQQALKAGNSVIR